MKRCQEPSSEPVGVVSYVYDGSGRLVSSECPSAVASEPPAPCRCTVCGQMTSYTY